MTDHDKVNRMDLLAAAELLGVSPTASADAVRNAFREQVRANHPDVRKAGDAVIDLRDLTDARDLLLEALEGNEPAPTKATAGATYTPPDKNKSSSPVSAKMREYQHGTKRRSRAAKPSSQRNEKAERFGVGVLLLLGAAVLIVAVLAVRALLPGGPSCVNQLDGQSSAGACNDDSNWEIVETHDDASATCEFPTERLAVEGQIWCVRPYTP